MSTPTHGAGRAADRGRGDPPRRSEPPDLPVSPAEGESVPGDRSGQPPRTPSGRTPQPPRESGPPWDPGYPQESPRTLWQPPRAQGQPRSSAGQPPRAPRQAPFSPAQPPRAPGA